MAKKQWKASTAQGVPAPVESLPEDKEDLAADIAAIEKRYGKEFMAVLVDLHDHVFGTTPVAPTEPSGLVAEVVGEKVNLSWTASEAPVAQPEAVPPVENIIEQYMVERANAGKDAKGEEITELTAVFAQIGVTKLLTYTDKGVLGSSYFYRVRSEGTLRAKSYYSEVVKAELVPVEEVVEEPASA